MDDALDLTAARNLSGQASKLYALIIGVSLTAGRGTITVCGHDDADPELVAIRPQAARADAQGPETEWEGHVDSIIFDRMLSP